MAEMKRSEWLSFLGYFALIVVIGMLSFIAAYLAWP